MKILFDLTSLAHNFSGIERYALSLSKEYIRQQPQNDYILVFKNAIHQDCAEIAKQPNVQCVILKGKNKPINKLIFNQFTLAAGLYKCEADRYVFPAFCDPILFFRKNIFATVHDVGWLDCPDTIPALRKLYFYVSLKKSLHMCRKIMTVSSFSKNRIMQTGHIPSEKIDIVPDGISEVFRSQRNIPKSRLEQYNLPDEYILTLSTLEPRKNFPLLIAAYEALSKTDHIPDLVLVGRKGWMMDDFLSKINNSEIGKKLHFTGFVADEDLPAIYANAKFFVFPSKYEGFGLPPLEAMACDAPVLSSDAASMPEVLGDAACYFHSEDVKSLTEKMREMLAMDEETRERMIRQGYEQAQRFTWENAAKALDEALKEQ